MKKFIAIVVMLMTYLSSGFLFGSIQGYVTNVDGLYISGATVEVYGFGLTTTNASGYYLLEPHPIGDSVEVLCYKNGYNISTEYLTTIANDTVDQDFVLSQPNITANPLYYSVTLNPGEYLTQYLSILNTGSGVGNWNAYILYPFASKSPDTSQKSKAVRSGEMINTINKTGNQGRSPDTLDCPFNSVFCYPPTAPDNAVAADAEYGYMCYQNFSGVSHDFNSITIWATHSSYPGESREILVEIYEDGSTPGNLISSTIDTAEPVATGYYLFGSYEIFTYTIDLPLTTATSGWIGLQATSGGSPIFYWVNTFATPSYPAMQNSSYLTAGLSMSLNYESPYNWLTLDEYEGTVQPNGGIQNVGVNFNAEGTQAGEVYTAQIIITTDPDVGTFNIPVDMTIAGIPLYPVYNLEAELVNMVTGQVDLTWMIDPAGYNSPSFQYFVVKKDGDAIGTTSDIFYTISMTGFGNHCYSVFPVYTEGMGVGETTCVEWEIPAYCHNPDSLYNEQWVSSQELVNLTIENCGQGMLDFIFPDYVSGSRFACDMEVALYDSYGDGWNGGSLDVFVNGNLVLDDITLTNGSGPEYFSFPVEDGDDISTIYTAGQWSYENSYEIYDGNGTLIYTAANESIPVGLIFGTCPQPSFILDVQPATGQIPEGQSMNITLTYDATGFPNGVYNEYLEIWTNDPQQLEDSILNQMMVYTPATFYGYVHNCNSGLPMAGVEVSAINFSATTNSIGYYEMNVDEDIYDVFFSLLGFESVVVVDSFATSGVMTEVSICMNETPYAVPWVLAEPGIPQPYSCQVTWGLPMGPYEIIYDDGDPDDFVIWTEPGHLAAVKFTPVGYPATILGGRINVGDGTFPSGANFIGSSMIAMVMDDDGANGMPGTLIDSTTIIISNYGWVDFYGSFDVTIQDGEFFLVLQQTGYVNSSAPIAVDTDPPTVYRSYTKMVNGSWTISPYQDFMIRAYVDGPNAGVVSSTSGKKVKVPKVTDGPFLATNLPTVIDGIVKDGEIKFLIGNGSTRDLTHYVLARVDDFDPVLGPQTGNIQPIANPTDMYYTDMGWGGLASGFYAYAVKAVYESNESTWVYSNIIGQGIDNEVTIVVTTCNNGDPDSSEVYLIGLNYPYHVHHDFTDQTGTVVFDSVIDGNYDLFISKPGYEPFPGYPPNGNNQFFITNDTTIGIELLQKMYPPTNLEIDPLTSVATWDEPLITQLYLEDFEDPAFPPDGWQATAIDVGWFRTDDASSGGWTVPPGDGYYAAVNDDILGTGPSNSTMDYLITPEVDLRESQGFQLHFDQFYDGAYGHSAYVEYSHDQGITWEVIETMSPNNDWNNNVVDLSLLSGPGTEPVLIAFHGDDHDGWASGWCVDNVEIKNGPAPVLAYYVFLDNVFEAQTSWDQTTYTFNNLVFGQEYEACVMAVYDCGVSDPICTTWESVFLQAPRNLTHDYTYGTDEVLLMWNPPVTASSSKAASFSVVYQGPRLDYTNPDSDLASEITIIEYEEKNIRDMGDLQFLFPVLGTNEAGCETDGNFIYTAEWNGDIYLKYDLVGNLIETFTIPGTSGVRDMAWDGNFFYGSAANSTVFVMDFDTKTLVSTFTAPTNVRALAYNHIDFTFYANNWGTDIVCFDQNGNNLGSFTPNVSSIYGLAFDNWSNSPVKSLWAYDQGENNLLQYELPGGVATGITIDVEQITGSTGIAGGLFSHSGLFEPDKVSIGGCAQNDIIWSLEIAAYSGGSGEIPDGLASFNLYRDGVNIANIPYEGQGTNELIEYIDNGLIPNPYVYEVTAEYALDIFGFPGQTAESDFEGPDTVNVVWGSTIPFFEDWESANFNFNNWTLNENSANWSISSTEGEPLPSAEFTWDPLLENGYSSTLTSYPIIVDYITEGDLFLEFDLKLIDRNTTGNEHMLVEVFDGNTWHLAADFSNSGSKTGFTNHKLNITPYTLRNAINIRFNATGQNSFDIISWFVDNISVYRECIPPEDLTGESTWDPTHNHLVNEICWSAATIPMPISEWIHWDSGENHSGVGLTDGGTFSVAARWNESHLEEYNGASISKVRFVPNEGFTQIILKIWKGANASTLLYSEDITAVAITDEWNEITLDQLIPVDATQELWVGYTITHSSGTFPAGTDNGPAIVGYGDMISTDGYSWDPVSSFGLNYNWNIQAFVIEQSSSATLNVLDEKPFQNINETLETGDLKEFPVIIIADDSRDISGFNIYRMSEYENEYEYYDFEPFVSGQTNFCYFDENVHFVMGYFYKVTAYYVSETDECESSYAFAYEIPEDDFVYVWPDGIGDFSQLENIIVYPNPAQDIIRVNSKEKIISLRLFNFTGQSVYTEIINNNSDIILNVDSLPQGVYIMRIETINGITTKKIVISR